MRHAAFAILLCALMGLGVALLPLGSPADDPDVVPGQEVPVVATPEPTPTPEVVTTPEPTPEPTTTPQPITTPEPTPEPPVEARAAQPAATATATPAPAAAAQQTVAVCHYTGSASMPYVRVEAPGGGGEHSSHPDDIIPAPEGGCPAQRQEPQPQPTPTPQPPRDVTLCHATGQRANPYVELTVRRRQVAEHERHGADIIPAPEGGCPASAPNEPVAPDDREDEVPPPAEEPPEPAPVPIADSAPETAPPAPAPAAAPAAVAVAPAAQVTGGGLPQTGAELIPIVMLAVGLMSMGAGLRLLTAR